MADSSNFPPNSPSVAVVIPAFNEAGRIQASLETVFAAQLKKCRITHILVVDDGSTDRTAHIVRATASRLKNEYRKISLIQQPDNAGKGAAVRSGVAAAPHVDAILMSDADLATPIGELDKLVDHLAEGYAVIIGSRVAPGAVLDPPRPPLRRLLAWGYRCLRRRVMLPRIEDTQCGFKLFRVEAAHRIFQTMQTDGFAFDCEVLALAEHFGFQTLEVGVIWNEKGESKVRPLRDVVGMLVQLIKIKKRLKRLYST
ncbi:MAG: glycosyltransferase [Planctomycetota bacterium]